MPPLCAILLLFIKVYGLLGMNIVQPEALVRAQLGETVTLPCFNPTKDVRRVHWIKQPLGLKPELVAMVALYQLNAKFFNEFKNSKRFSATVAEGNFTLIVSQVGPSDSATYYCVSAHFDEISFGDGTTLMVMGSKSNSRAVVLQQPESESVQPGDSVQCTVHTDAGTYYCAVATCGEIQFGNGTKLNVEQNEHLPLYCLAGALTVSVILNIVLALIKRKSCENCKGAASKNQVTGEDLASKQSQDAAMNYAALTFTNKKPKVRRKKREVEKELVYSDTQI